MKKLNVLEKKDTNEQTVAQQRSKVGISPNLTKISERVDINGNVIDPKTKQIIRKADE